MYKVPTVYTSTVMTKLEWATKKDVKMIFLKLLYVSREWLHIYMISYISNVFKKQQLKYNYKKRAIIIIYRIIKGNNVTFHSFENRNA